VFFALQGLYCAENVGKLFLIPITYSTLPVDFQLQIQVRPSWVSRQYQCNCLRIRTNRSLVLLQLSQQILMHKSR